MSDVSGRLRLGLNETHEGALGGRSLPDRAARHLHDDVEMTEVSRVFLHQMEQDAFERGRRGAV